MREGPGPARLKDLFSFTNASPSGFARKARDGSSPLR